MSRIEGIKLCYALRCLGMDSFGDDVRSGDFSEELFMSFVISRKVQSM